MGGRVHSRLVQVICANQWVVGGGKVSMKSLNRLAQATLRSTGRCLYDYYHNLRQPKEVLRIVEFTPRFEDYLSRQGHEAMLMVCPHVSNFDLIGYALAVRGIRFQVLSYPQPPASYRWQNRFRQLEGMDVTPMSLSAMQAAEERLRNQGMVLTGVDRPLPESRYRPRFFGRPAALPAFHVRLALKFRLPIIVVGGLTMPDGHVQAWATDPIIMQSDADLYQEVVQNAEAVLAEIEPVIRQNPEQWSMFYPVWPEALGEVSGHLEKRNYEKAKTR